ncbi:hypothetical protein E3Q12_04123 [Wallemia mellicola]|nr:hypothetical protein E3Q12_04123 [Wallemia mellicola]
MIKISTKPEDKVKNDFKLLELNDELVKALDDQKLLLFKGDGDEDVVLCTQDNTYSLKNRMHSNSLTMLDESTNKDEYSIAHTFHEILEVQKCSPNIDKIDMLLSHRVLLDPTEVDNNVEERLKYDYDRISSEIQASDKEIRQAFTDRRIVCFNGEYRPVDPECLLRTLDVILNTLELVDMSFNKVDKDELADSINKDHNINREYISTVIGWYMNSDTTLDSQAFVKEIGLSLLKVQSRATAFEKFLDDWKSRSGYELQDQCNLNLLKGYYLIEAGQITYFTTSSLSKNPSKRFQELFKTRQKWFSVDFIPFIRDLGDSKELERMVMKFCRTQTDKDTGMETYTSRQRI